MLNFHDISITGKVTVIFPSFQAFPGDVGALPASMCRYDVRARSHTATAIVKVMSLKMGS